MDNEIKGTDVPEVVITPTEKALNEDNQLLVDKSYLSSLRNEAKENRLKLKETEKLLKSALGLSDDEEVNIEKINNFKTQIDSKLNDAISKSNELILKATINNLDGYDTKLVSKLLDKSTISVNDLGEVIGLEEAVNKLVEEFPSIKKSIQPNLTSNPASAQSNELQLLNEQLEIARLSGNTTMIVALKNIIFNLK